MESAQPLRRRAQPGELAAINALIAESEQFVTGCDIDEFLGRYAVNSEQLKSSQSYVLAASDQLAGFFMIVTAGGDAELEYFYVERSLIGQGFGRLMWRHVEEVCRDNAIPRLSIVCGQSVTPFYVRMGARRIGDKESLVYSGETVDVLRFDVPADAAS